MRNLGIVLVIFGLIRLWIESKIKNQTAAAPVSAGMQKADFVLFRSNITTTYTFIIVGLLLYFNRQVKEAL